MKKVIAIVLCLVTMLSMAACGQTANSAEASTEPKETGVIQEAPKVEKAEEPAKVTKLTEEAIKTPAKAPSQTTAEAPSKTTAEAPSQTTAEVPSKTTAEVPSQTTAEAPNEATAEAPNEATAEAPNEATAEAPSKTTAEAPSQTSAEETNKESSEVSEEPTECAHRWEAAGEGEEGMILYECVDCSAMKLEYKCTHEYCLPETLTDADGMSYTRYTCYGCGYTYTSSNTAGQEDKAEDSGASTEEPADEPTEVPEEPVECTNHRYDYSAEPETGFVFRTCLDCAAQELVYKCPHDVLYKEQLTDADGVTYTHSICYGCNEEFITYD